MRTCFNESLLVGLLSVIGLMLLPANANAAGQNNSGQSDSRQGIAEQGGDNQGTEVPSVADTTPLSIQPLDQKTYPKDRPEWIDALPEFDEESYAIARWPVTSGPTVTAEAASQVLEMQMHGAFEAYAERILGREVAMELLGEAHLAYEFSVVEQYEGALQLGNETVYEAAALLEFDERDAAILEDAWMARQREKRMPWLLSGVGALFAFCTMGTLISRRLAKRLSVEH